MIPLGTVASSVVINGNSPIIIGELSNLMIDYPGAVGAHSLLALSPAYVSTSPVVRVRRSSDNTEQDFTATQVADGTLTTFCGGGNGFVRTLYDQSGNGRHASQTTTSAQRVVVVSGVLQTDDGIPCWVSQNDNQKEFFTYDSSGANATYFGVMRPDASESFWIALGASNAAILLVSAGDNASSDGKGLAVGTSIQIYKNSVLQNIVSRNSAYIAFPSNTRYLVTATNVNMLSINWNSVKYITAYSGGTANMVGKSFLSILYDTDMSAQRESIDATIKSAFNLV